MTTETQAPEGAQELCERICAAIQAADDKSMAEAGYMLDCNDCCRIVRDQFAASNVQPKGMPAEWLDAFEEWRQTLGAADLDGKRDLVWRHIAGTGFQAGAAWARSQAPAPAHDRKAQALALCHALEEQPGSQYQTAAVLAAFKVYRAFESIEKHGEIRQWVFDVAAPCAAVGADVPAGMVLVPRELLTDAAESIDDYRAGVEFGSCDRKLLGRLKAAAAQAPTAAQGAVTEEMIAAFVTTAMPGQPWPHKDPEQTEEVRVNLRAAIGAALAAAPQPAPAPSHASDADASSVANRLSAYASSGGVMDDNCRALMREAATLLRSKKEPERLRNAAEKALNLFTDQRWGTVPYMDSAVYEDAAKVSKCLSAALAGQAQATPCMVCNALTVPRNATHYDADDLAAAKTQAKIVADSLNVDPSPAAGDDPRVTPPEMEDWLGVYWDAAYNEGKTGANNAARANEALQNIRRIVREAARSQSQSAGDRVHAELWRLAVRKGIVEVESALIDERNPGTRCSWMKGHIKACDISNYAADLAPGGRDGE